ncbi:MAG: hypothetical protein NC117_02595 [Pseudoflavonifractor sp.]|nr:hypothetical protein [Pseudoflavonifractor sp.]
MKPTSLGHTFVVPVTDIDLIASQTDGPDDSARMAAIADAGCDMTVDFIRKNAPALLSAGLLDQIIEAVGKAEPDGPDTTASNAARLQLLTSLLIEKGNLDEALDRAAEALREMAQEPRRRDERFLSILASLLYDLAYLHVQRKEYRHAEREITKSLKVLERLAKENPTRYGAAHLSALSASTGIYKSRVNQANLLAHYQVASSTYLEMMNHGIKDAGMKLVESLQHEGDTLMDMSKYREAIQYYTRALRYLTKLSPEFSPLTLRLSVKLGDALLRGSKTRQKGVHLLNTMLQKATRLDDKETVGHINMLLERDATKWYDIFALWHKLFPR